MSRTMRETGFDRHLDRILKHQLAETFRPPRRRRRGSPSPRQSCRSPYVHPWSAVASWRSAVMGAASSAITSPRAIGRASHDPLRGNQRSVA